MTDRWEPTEAELRAVIVNYCFSAGPHDPEQSYGCPECRAAFAKELRLVGPMIAARALREAAASFVVNVDDPIPSVSAWLRARADAMEAP